MTPMTDVLVVECEDTGPGIAIDKLATLFTPSDEVKSSTSHDNKMYNSGLGLYSVANEISSIGGNFGFFPREDLNESSESLCADPISGSVFWFTIPLIEPASRKVSSTVNVDEDRLETHISLEHSLATAKITDSLSSLSSMESSASRPKRSLDRTNKVFPVAKRGPAHRKNILKHSGSPKHHDVASAFKSVPKKTVQRSKRVLVIDDSITIRKARKCF